MGGGMYILNSEFVNILNSRFIENMAYNGGAIYIENSKEVIVQKSKINNNYAS